MFRKILIAIAVYAISITALHAQAHPTATRPISFQVGAGWSNANTDYLPQRVNGTTLFVDCDFYHHLGIEGEFRYLKDGQSNVYEKTYEIGPRYSRTYHERYSPYVKALYGRGVFNFTYGGQTLANLAYNMMALGGGLDYSLVRHINLRGEYEYQHWFGFPDHGLTPTMVTVGAAYRF